MVFVFGFGSTAFAQNKYAGSSSVTPHKTKLPTLKIRAYAPKDQAISGSNDSFEALVHSLGAKTNVPSQTKAFTYSIIGTTEYQNQTNAAIDNRIIKNPDGSISASWTFAADPGWSDRGTGYNYYDALTSSWSAFPTSRLENTRTGFTNIGVTGTGAEFAVAHEAPTTGTGLGTHIVSRPSKGTGVWTDAVLGAADTWPVFSVGGATKNTLHIISQTSGTTAVPYMGQDGAISYSRSLDGGLTWDKLRTVIPEIGSSFYLGFGGNAYSMDTKGDTIVIVAGGFDVDVVMVKSIDNGNSWTKTVIYKFPIPLYNSATMTTDTNSVPDGIADTLESNDASVNVVLDNLGRAHVFYGRMFVMCDAPGTATGQGLSYFPETDGLMYWNETMGASAPVMIANVKDYNADGVMNIYNDPLGNVLGFGKYQCSMTSFATSGVDAAGNLYLSYSSVFEGINDMAEGYDIANGLLIDPVTVAKSYRHQYVMRSTDNGATWCDPIDITQPSYTSTAFDYHEGMYGAMARNVDGFVHMIVQDDGAPGHGVGTASSPSPDLNNSTANIIYYKIPVAELSACGASINERSSSTDLTIYPNPASNNVNVVLNSTKATTANINVYNMVGQTVAQFEKNIVSGNNTMKLDISSFNTGIYFLSVNVDGKNYSQKLIVK